MEQKHFVLVHGVCHGAWCWFKLKTRLELAGHKVTALDLAASGINTKKIEDVHTFYEYSEPLLEFMASLGPNEKVILVGHSFGGLTLALAMDKFPQKIALAVFVAAFVPDTHHKPSYVLEELNKRYQISTGSSDAQLNSSRGGKTTFLFDPQLLSTNLYQLCSPEDLELAKTLTRTGSLFLEDLSEANNFSKEGYGYVPSAYIVCSEDLIIPLEYQKWMIQNAGIDKVREIKGSDHMAMLSKPQELCSSLVELTEKHA
ncbi:hypothetical protein RIF29_37097 [Crotalaria pallida]|uniref:(S)-hydroxynitrile lyase n=1 Tax=Crotalaria pallida TaxID=3830 RepID=A0AAN9EE93_CROPI